MYGMSRLTEMKMILANKQMESSAFQKKSIPFFAAKEDIRMNILSRRNMLIAERVFNKKELERYLQLSQPFKHNMERPQYKPM